jgi:hypothetical protein
MDLHWLISQMEANAKAIRALAVGCSDRQARWKLDPASWSVLEVVNHLLDEEREDFLPRIDVMLRRGGDVWFPIDPEGWVTQRGYNQRELGPSIEAFMTARGESLVWLRGLGGADWTVGYEAPFGSIRAGDILAAWAAHDLLHQRQLVELKWAYLVRSVQPYGVEYAGPW